MVESRFQSFRDEADPAQGPPRLAALRAELERRGLAGFVVPRADEHQNEYVPPAAERLQWLTGFTGSAGMAVVLADAAAIFVDGRYTLQVREQVDAGAFAPHDLARETPSAWLARMARAGQRIGYDPWLHTPAQVAALRKALEDAGASLVAVETNPIDAVWADRPAAPTAPVFLHPARLAGEAADKKLARIAGRLTCDALVVSDPHAAAWAFNMRGGDVAHTPLPLCWALVPRAGRPRLYVDARKLSNSVRDALENLADVAPVEKLKDDLAALGARKASVLFDAATAPDALVEMFRAAGGAAEMGVDPIALMKATKSAAELRGARAAHLRDGAAVARFLRYFAENATRLTEISAAQALETFRRETKKLAEISFPTISAFGAHAASPHYRVTEKTNVRIGRGIYLVDSGAQYVDGTTDITRSVAVGRPSAQMRDRFTRVLKGHIAIATAVFPEGTTGAQIDAFARRALWEAGLDFDHGTGHGVGAFLSVHEGPQRISKLGTTPLSAGMIVSNEPGYYKDGDYGIRIENLLVVEPRVIAGGDRKMLGFETLTLAPIDLALVDARLMRSDEIAWLNAYHARVRALLAPKLDPATAKWLKGATRRLG